MYSEQYIKQVKLLLQCLPAIREQNDFAIKGGTAINLFIHDLPRFSVDIDLTYRHLEDREVSLAKIQAGLSNITNSLKKRNNQFIIKEQMSQKNRLLQNNYTDKYQTKPVIKIHEDELIKLNKQTQEAKLQVRKVRPQKTTSFSSMTLLGEKSSHQPIRSEPEHPTKRVKKTLITSESLHL
jgi:predicted nucleotidyltransferase component of viral defense system